MESKIQQYVSEAQSNTNKFNEEINDFKKQLLNKEQET